VFILSHKVETSVVSHFMDLVDEADKDKDGKLDFEEWQFMGKLSGHIHRGSISRCRKISSLKNHTPHTHG